MLGSVFCVGLGQLINGKARRAFLYLIIFGASLLIVEAFAIVAGIHSYFTVFNASFTAMGLILACSVIDTVFLSLRSADPSGGLLLKRIPLLVAYVLLAWVFIPVSFMLARKFALEPYRTRADSMFPALPKETHLVVRKKGPLPLQIGRGDILIYRSPKDSSKIMIHRAIALPGDRITINGKDVQINGKSLQSGSEDRESINHSSYRVIWKTATEFPRFQVDETIPSEHLFVMGDNRDESYDSRMQGPIPMELVDGVIWQVFADKEWEELCARSFLNFLFHKACLEKT